MIPYVSQSVIVASRQQQDELCLEHLDAGVLLLDMEVLLFQLSNSGEGSSFCILLHLQGSLLSSCLCSQLVKNLQKVFTAIQNLQLVPPKSPIASVSFFYRTMQDLSIYQKSLLIAWLCSVTFPTWMQFMHMHPCHIIQGTSHCGSVALSTIPQPRGLLL